MSPLLIAYYRVSTAMQGRSGLGLAGQRAAVRDYARRTKARIVAEYTEVESGRKAKRPQLAAALADTKARRAVLIVAKLDRLARDERMIADILASGIDVRFLDLPDDLAGAAGRLLVMMMAAFAAFESRRIGERVKAGYDARRARGGAKWRAHRARMRRLSRAGRAVQDAAVAAHRLRVVPVVQRYHDGGRSYTWIAGRLNQDGVTAPRGGPWTVVNLKSYMRLATAKGAGHAN